MKSFSKIVTLLLLVLTANAFAGDMDGNVYGSNEVRRVENVQTGHVIAIRNVVTQDNSQTNTIIGTGAGASIGGIIGATAMGKGKGRAVDGALMALVGGIAGNQVNNYLSKGDGVEIVVKLDAGNVVAITQGADDDSRALHVGDAVMLLQGGNARVVRM